VPISPSTTGAHVRAREPFQHVAQHLLGHLSDALAGEVGRVRRPDVVAGPDDDVQAGLARKLSQPGRLRHETRTRHLHDAAAAGLLEVP